MSCESVDGLSVVPTMTLKSGESRDLIGVQGFSMLKTSKRVQFTLMGIMLVNEAGCEFTWIKDNFLLLDRLTISHRNNAGLIDILTIDLSIPDLCLSTGIGIDDLVVEWKLEQ